MKQKINRLLMGVLLCVALGSIVHIFMREHDFAVRLSVVVSNLLFAALVLHGAVQGRKARTALRLERDHLRDILNHIPLPLFIADKDRNLNFINAAAQELFSCNADVLGKQCQCLNTGICNTPACAITQMERTGNGRAYYEAGGKTYMVSTAALEVGAAKNGRYIELIQDITDVIEAKKQLEEKTIELETMSENLVGGVLITTFDEGFPVIRCNQGYRDMTGRTDAQIVGHHAMQWVLSADAARLSQKIEEQLSASDEVCLEHRLHCESGTLLWVSLRGKRTTLRGQTVGVWILTDISAAKETELALRIDEERYRIAMQSTEDIIIDYDLNTHVMYHSSKAKEIYDVPELVENMPQSILDSGTVLDESREVYLDLFRQLYANVPSCSCVLKARAADGRILWNRLTFTAIFDDDGSAAHAIGILQDITREKKIELQQEREARYLELSSQDGNFYYEADLTHRRFLSGHENAVQLYGEGETDDFDEVIALLLRHKVYEPDRALVRARASAATLAENFAAGVLRTVVEYRRIVSGELIWSECAMQCFLDGESGDLRCVGCIRNVNERKKKELALQEKAERDLLTGLYNKVTAELLVKNAVEFAEKDTPGGAFLLMDVDDFKNVNDTLGHACGDEVLAEVAHGLLSLFRQDDIVGRIGGDEFVAYMHHLGSTDSAAKKAQQVCDLFGKIRVTADPAYRISATVGIALFPAHGETFDELYRNADRALYRAKASGKNQFALPL